MLSDKSVSLVHITLQYGYSVQSADIRIVLLCVVLRNVRSIVVSYTPYPYGVHSLHTL